MSFKANILEFNDPDFRVKGGFMKFNSEREFLKSGVAPTDNSALLVEYDFWGFELVLSRYSKKWIKNVPVDILRSDRVCPKKWFFGLFETSYRIDWVEVLLHSAFPDGSIEISTANGFSLRYADHQILIGKAIEFDAYGPGKGMIGFTVKPMSVEGFDASREVAELISKFIEVNYTHPV
jgi:hypothetical protein